MPPKMTYNGVTVSKAQHRSNGGLVAAVVVLVLVILAAVGYIVYREVGQKRCKTDADCEHLCDGTGPCNYKCDGKLCKCKGKMKVRFAEGY